MEMKMEHFSLDLGQDGIMIVTFDSPGRSMNTISHAVQRELASLTDVIASDDRIVGAVIQSGKAAGFCAGADLRELRADSERWSSASSQEELRAALAEASNYSRQVRELELVGKPIVAIINGATLGGGFELALGCHFRLAIDEQALCLGLPEATLGLMPGAGGTQRLIRLAGLGAALPYMLDGGPIAPDDAISLGIVHELVTADNALDRARRWILDGGDATAPWDRKDFRLPGILPHSPSGYATLSPLIATRRGATGPGSADGYILKAAYEGAQVPIDAGLRIESRYFLNLLRTPAASAKIDAFFARRKKLA
jgi:enoyl-CoA hydratase